MSERMSVRSGCLVLWPGLVAPLVRMLWVQVNCGGPHRAKFGERPSKGHYQERERSGGTMCDSRQLSRRHHRGSSCVLRSGLSSSSHCSYPSSG